jgi:hypothetical protein
MSVINIPRREADALKAVDVKALSGLIDQCLRDEQVNALRTLRLGDCGPYIANKLHEFGCALNEYRNAKSASKRTRTGDGAQRAGDALKCAVEQMINRLQVEEAEGQLFRVDDVIPVPYALDEDITVRVGFQWRASVDDAWQYGCIVFSHRVHSRPYYARSEPKRKKSAAQQSRERQDELLDTWDRLKEHALFSVRDFFRAGGDGADIPKTFQVKADPYSGGLNNFSADFWRQREGTAAGIG